MVWVTNGNFIVLGELPSKYDSESAFVRKGDIVQQAVMETGLDFFEEVNDDEPPEPINPGEGTSGMQSPDVESRNPVSVRLAHEQQPRDGHRQQRNNSVKKNLKKKHQNITSFEEREFKLRRRQILLQIKQDKQLFVAEMQLKELEKQKILQEIKNLKAKNSETF